MSTGLRSGDSTRVIQRRLKAVISCQQAGKDNRVDSQLRPKGIIEVIGRSLQKRVFSRPGPQEPEEGLPGLAEENPNGRSMGKDNVPCGEQRGPIRSRKGLRSVEKPSPVATRIDPSLKNCFFVKAIRFIVLIFVLQ